MKNVTYEFSHMLLGEKEMERINTCSIANGGDNFWYALSDIEAKYPNLLISAHGFLQMFVGKDIYLFFEFDCEDKEVLSQVQKAYKRLYQPQIVHIRPEFQDSILVRKGIYQCTQSE